MSAQEVTQRKRAPKKPKDPLAGDNQPEDLRRLWARLQELADQTTGNPELVGTQVQYTETEQSAQARKEYIELYSQILEVTKAYSEDYKQKLEKYQQERQEYLQQKQQQLHGGTYRMSKHLLSQTAQYKPNRHGIPITLDTLLEPTKKQLLEAIEPGSYERYQVTGQLPTADQKLSLAVGVNVSAAQYKIIDCLCKLLHDRSNTKEGAPNYYLGNTKAEKREYPIYNEDNRRVQQYANAPRLTFTLHELAKEYYSAPVSGGKQISNIYRLLRELERQRFFIHYERIINNPEPTEQDKKREKRYGKLLRVRQQASLYDNLITLISLDENKGYQQEDTRNSTVVIELNPVFIDQIDKRFVLIPRDINHQTAVAAGGTAIAEPTIKLRNYLIQAIANNSFKKDPDQEYEITRQNLELLLQGQNKHRKRKRQLEELQRAITACYNLGLITKAEIRPGQYADKYVFTLNKDWHKQDKAHSQEPEEQKPEIAEEQPHE